MADGFAIRNRGTHLPDHIRRLELIGNPTNPRSPRTSRASPNHITSSSDDGYALSPSPRRDSTAPRFRPLAVPQFTRDIVATGTPQTSPSSSHSTGDREFANIFANLNVWVDASVRKCVFHAGFDKARVYVQFLDCVLEAIAPHNDSVQRSLQELHAYIQYLSSTSTPSEEVTSAVALQPNGHTATVAATQHVASLRLDRLSPKVTFQCVALVPQLLQQRTPPSSTNATPQAPPRALSAAKQAASSGQQQQQQQQQPHLLCPARRKFVQMSDHEERVLELVLFFDEALRRNNSSNKRGAALRAMDARVLYTTQWLLLSTVERHRILRQRKRQLARQTFFSCNAASRTHGVDDSAAAAARRQHHSMPHASYLSLVLVCLHETLRCLRTFSLELAAFACRVLCTETLAACDALFARILATQHAAAQALDARKRARSDLQQQIATIEAEIQRLQAQNMRSLAISDVEIRELEMLEAEEAWHGHCKALLIDCVASLQDTIRTPVWLQQSRSGATAVDYARLTPGFALFDLQARHAVVYMAHLALLCRSYLHLHERRGVRDVLLATSIAAASAVDPCDARTALRPQSTPCDDDSSNSFVAATNPMEKISRSELQTLSAIHDALRSMEILYAATGATSSDSSNSSDVEPLTTTTLLSARSKRLALRSLRPRVRSSTTQFPEVVGGGTDAADDRSVSRLQSYRISAATTTAVTPLTSTPQPLGASDTICKTGRIEAAAPCGSGRRQSSVRSHGASDSNNSVGLLPLQLCLDKAALQLPLHLQSLLVLLPLPPARSSSSCSSDGVDNSDDTCSRDDAVAVDNASLVTCLSPSEIVEWVHWVYRTALDTVWTPLSWSAASMVPSGACDMLAVPLVDTSNTSNAAGGNWSSSDFCAFIYASLLDAANGNVAHCERTFVRLFASIQCVLPGGSSSSSAALSMAAIGGATGSNCSSSSLSTTVSETIMLFAMLTQLVHVQQPSSVVRPLRPLLTSSPYLPSRVFPVVLYVQRMLLHVAITKRSIENNSSSSSSNTLEVWTLAGDEATAWGLTTPSGKLAPVPPSSMRRTMIGPATLHVLLESVRVLLRHVASCALVVDTNALLDARLQVLVDKSVAATVALVTPATPGPYSFSSTTTTTTTAATATATATNGQLADASIVSLDLAVATIVRAWLDVHHDVARRIGSTLQSGALTDRDGRLSFDEFVYVMAPQAVGGASGPQQQQQQHQQSATRSGTNGLSHARLAQIYAHVQATATTSVVQDASVTRSVHWTSLQRAVVDGVDVLGMRERFASTDFRSIQHALLTPNAAIASCHRAFGGAFAAAWVLGSAASRRSSGSTTSTTATTQSLVTSWRLHRVAMREHLTLAFQADSALTGIRCWQTGLQRLDRVQLLVGYRYRPQQQQRVAKRSAVAATAAGDSKAAAATTSADKDERAACLKAQDDDDDRAVVELDADTLSVAWKTYQLLQWDHAQALHLVDDVRRKQQRLQRANANANAAAAAASTSTPISSSPSSNTSITNGPKTPNGSTTATKVDEMRPHRPVGMTTTTTATATTTTRRPGRPHA